MVRLAYALFPASLLLAGCTSFSGVPEPVITVQQARQMVDGNLPDAVISNMATMTPDQRTVTRNRVVATYLMAADAKYDAFRAALSRNVKGGNVAFDLATLGLTGIASRWTSAAKDLAAGATVVGGARASLNKELYFEKTLPALLSLMDSSRLTVRADILKGLSKPETDYTIEDAFSDIWRYQSAASIDGAIQQAAAAAADKADETQIDYSKAVEYCTVSAVVANDRRTIITTLEDLVDPTTRSPQQITAGRELIRQAAVAAGVKDAALTTDGPQTLAQLKQVSDYLLSLCAAEPVAAFRRTLEEKGVTFNG